MSTFRVKRISSRFSYVTRSYSRYIVVYAGREVGLIEQLTKRAAEEQAERYQRALERRDTEYKVVADILREEKQA